MAKRRKQKRRQRKIPRNMGKMRMLGVRRKAIITSPSLNLGTSGVYFAPTFKISDLPDFEDMTGLFQQMKLNAVKLQLIPKYTIAQSVAVGSERTQILIHSVYDPSNELDVATATQNSFLQYANCKSKPLIKSNQGASYYYSKVNPQVVIDGADALAQNSRRNRARLTANTDGADIEHQGLKFWIENSSGEALATSNIEFMIVATYYATFYGVN